jgi:hypothetical protein
MWPFSPEWGSSVTSAFRPVNDTTHPVAGGRIPAPVCSPWDNRVDGGMGPGSRGKTTVTPRPGSGRRRWVSARRDLVWSDDTQGQPESLAQIRRRAEIERAHPTPRRVNRRATTGDAWWFRDAGPFIHRSLPAHRSGGTPYPESQRGGYAALREWKLSCPPVRPGDTGPEGGSDAISF